MKATIARLFLTVSAIAVPAIAQTTTPTTPAPTATPAATPAATPSGGTPIGTGNGAAGATQTFFESQMLSYGALDQITQRIASDICPTAGGGWLGPGAHVVLFDTTSFLTVQQYHSFARAVDFLTALLRSFVPDASADSIRDLAEDVRKSMNALVGKTKAEDATAGGSGIQVAEGVFSTLSSVIGASTADKNTTFPLSDIAIAMSLSQHLKANASCGGVEITYPRVALYEDPRTVANAEQSLSDAMTALFKISRRAADVAQQAEDSAKLNDKTPVGSGAGPTPATSQSAALNSAFPSQFQVTVKDAAGNALGGVTVTFLAPAAGPSGTFAGGSTSAPATTNGQGIATAPVFTANGTPGNYSVVATAAGVGQIVSFSLTNTSTSPATLSPAGGAPPATPPAPPNLPVAPPRSVKGSDYLSITTATGLLNTFLSSYLQPAAATGVSPISGVLTGAQLLRLLLRPNTYIVFWEGSAAGGTQRDRKNLLTNVFTGDLLSYSGGAVLSFGMINAATGDLKQPVVHRVMSKYTRIKSPSKNIENGIRQGADFSQ
jgi:hypothetical protein